MYLHGMVLVPLTCSQVAFLIMWHLTKDKYSVLSSVFVEYVFEQDFHVQLIVFITVYYSETVRACSFITVK
jgi:hypothetical protein